MLPGPWATYAGLIEPPISPSDEWADKVLVKCFENSVKVKQQFINFMLNKSKMCMDIGRPRIHYIMKMARGRSSWMAELLVFCCFFFRPCGSRREEVVYIDHCYSGNRLPCAGKGVARFGLPALRCGVGGSVSYRVVLIVAVWLGIQINSPDQKLLFCILLSDNTLYILLYYRKVHPIK